MQNFKLCFFLLALLACGRAKDKAQSVQAHSTSSPRLTWELLEPEKEMGPWKRVGHLSVGPGSVYGVEKKTAPSNVWHWLASTDMQGNFIDDNISQDAEYRIGETYLSGMLPGVRDFELPPGPLNPTEFKAYRIIVPPGKTSYIGAGTVKIKAQVFILHGNIHAFPEDSVGGQNAGNLFLDANSVLGEGEIALLGQRGGNGAPGVKGPVLHSDDAHSRVSIGGSRGGAGGEGQRGGAGGNIYIARENLGRLRLFVSGGSGGHGGLPGPGGDAPPRALIASAGEEGYGPENYAGPQGYPGNPGDSGHDGLIHNLENSF